jgi:ribose transport system ATP-binding protein
MIEIAAICDRATVLREGETVGVVDVTEGSEDRIVELMLGQIVDQPPAVSERTTAQLQAASAKPRLAVRGLAHGTRLQDVTFDIYPGEVLGVAALEGQGQTSRSTSCRRRPSERRRAARGWRRCPSAT